MQWISFHVTNVITLHENKAGQNPRLFYIHILQRIYRSVGLLLSNSSFQPLTLCYRLIDDRKSWRCRSVIVGLTLWLIKGKIVIILLFAKIVRVRWFAKKSQKLWYLNEIREFSSKLTNFCIFIYRYLLSGVSVSCLLYLVAGCLLSSSAQLNVGCRCRCLLLVPACRV